MVTNQQLMEFANKNPDHLFSLKNAEKCLAATFANKPMYDFHNFRTGKMSDFLQKSDNGVEKSYGDLCVCLDYGISIFEPILLSGKELGEGLKILISDGVDEAYAYLNPLVRDKEPEGYVSPKISS